MRLAAAVEEEPQVALELLVVGLTHLEVDVGLIVAPKGPSIRSTHTDITPQMAMREGGTTKNDATRAGIIGNTITS